LLWGSVSRKRQSRSALPAFKILEIISSEDTPEDVVPVKVSTDEIEKAITKLLIENNSQNQPVNLAKVGNFLTKRFSDFDVRNYGYSKLSTFLESLNSNDFHVVKLHNGYFVQEKTASVPKSEIEKEICRLIKNNKGRVDNLSIIHEDLKKTFPSFDVKQYGFSRLSSFIRSFNTFKIKDNVVQMR
jgi:hypothetical protein